MENDKPKGLPITNDQIGKITVFFKEELPGVCFASLLFRSDTPEAAVCFYTNYNNRATLSTLLSEISNHITNPGSEKRDFELKLPSEN
jgi:hypothetical protein